MSSKSIKIKDVSLRITSGGTPLTTDPSYYDGNIPWLRTQEVDFKRIYSTDKKITKEGLENSSAKLIPANSVIVAMYGATAGKVAINKIPLSTNQACCNIIPDPEKINYEYFYYYLQGQYKNLLNSAIGAAQQNLSSGQIGNYEINIFDLPTQNKIAKILGDLDQKIELNRKMNKTLEEMGQALFKHYFVDNPQASKWEIKKLGEITFNFDSKRIPLSSNERSKRKGDFRYFGATSIMDYIDDFLFEGKYLLVAEDGSVLNIDDTPILQYVWGQFWVNNHAHVLQGKPPFTVEYLYLLLRQTNVLSLISGAVQLKINQGALNALPIVRPPDELILKFTKKIEPIFQKIRINSDSIESLSVLRDSLLIRLISGKISV
jgi:type I restriction enzyme S subunit